MRSVAEKREGEGAFSREMREIHSGKRGDCGCSKQLQGESWNQTGNRNNRKVGESSILLRVRYLKAAQVDQAWEGGSADESAELLRCAGVARR